MNLSARGVAGGDKRLIAGFVIGGSAPKRVLVRAIGPSLAQFGVGGHVLDPRLILRDAAGDIVWENDDWGGDDRLAVDFAAAGAFGLLQNAKDAAYSEWLMPGNYTLECAVAAADAGIALLEAYELP